MTTLVTATKTPEWLESFVFALDNTADVDDEADELGVDLGGTEDDGRTDSFKQSHGSKGQFLELDLFACDAHTEAAQQALSDRMRCDGPRPFSSPEGAGAHTSTSTVPLPVRTLARA